MTATYAAPSTQAEDARIASALAPAAPALVRTRIGCGGDAEQNPPRAAHLWIEDEIIHGLMDGQRKRRAERRDDPRGCRAEALGPQRPKRQSDRVEQSQRRREEREAAFGQRLDRK